MARGPATQKIKIGHSITGEWNGCRYNWYVAKSDPGEAKRVADQLGFEGVKIYPIYKEENNCPA